MIGSEYIQTLSGRDLHDRDGNKIGTVGQIWDDGTGNPGWASVRTGLFGMNESLVPLQDADLRDDHVVVPFDKSMVKDAPNIDASHDEPLGHDDVGKLYDYYGMSRQDSFGSGATATAANYPGSQADPGYLGSQTDAGYSGTQAGSSYTDAQAGPSYTDAQAAPSYTGTASAGTARTDADYQRADYEGSDRQDANYAAQGDVMSPGEQTPARRPGLRRYVTTDRNQNDVPTQRDPDGQSDFN